MKTAQTIQKLRNLAKMYRISLNLPDSETDLPSFRVGWILYCTRGAESECQNDSELLGYKYAETYEYPRASEFERLIYLDVVRANRDISLSE